MRRWIVAAAAALLVTSAAARGGDTAAAKPMTWPADVVVVDEDGKPVEGARVEAFADSAAPPRSDGRELPPDEFLDPARKKRIPDSATTTDASGAAHVTGLQFGRSVVVVTRPGFAPRRREVTNPGDESPVRFELVRGHPLDGRVLLDDGRPIAGALVVAAYDEHSFMYLLDFSGEASPFDPWTRTDAAGRWHFDALPEREVVIVAAPAGTWTSRLDRLRLPGVTHYDFVLEPQSPLSGTVRDKATGDPIPGAVVDVEIRSMFTQHARAVADAHGRWSIPLVPSNRYVEITASAKGWAPIEWSGEAEDCDVLVERAPAEAPPQPAPAWVRGIVLSAYGWPKSGVEIRREGRHPHVESADDGTFVLPCDSDATGVRVWAVAEKGDFVTEIAVPSATVATALPVVLRWPPSTATVPKFRITGVVRPPEGMELSRPLVTEDWHAYGDRRERWARASDDGRFDLETSRGPGDYRSISATADGCAVTTVSKPQPDVEILLTPGATLRGRVVADGEPVARASIRLRVTDWQPGRFEKFQWPLVLATSSDDGSFTTATLPPGKFDVMVSAAGTLMTRAPVELIDGKTAAIDVSLLRPKTIRGVVKWPDGAPVVGERVSARRTTGDPKYWQDGDDARARTDAQGAFVLSGLRPGKFDLHAFPYRLVDTSRPEPPRAYFLGTPLLGVEAGESSVSIVVRVGAALRGHVVDARGNAVAGADVHLREQGDIRGSDLSRDTVSASDGAFALPCLDDGPYVLTVRAAALRTVRVEDVRVGGDDLRVVLPDGLTLEGVVVDAAGAPLSGRTIEATLRDDRCPGPDKTVLARTDESGKFALAGLDEGRTRIRVGGEKPGEWEYAAPRYTDAGASDVRVVVLAEHVLTGVVTDYAGPYSFKGSLPGAAIRVEVEGGADPFLAVADEDGVFAIGGLPWAKCTVHATLDGFEEFVGPADFPGALQDRVALRPKPAK